MTRSFLVALTLLLVAGFPPVSEAQELAASATGFLSTLTTALRERAHYDFDDKERFNWHYIPRRRNGVSFRELNDAQKASAFVLLKSSLSDQGYKKALAIIELEKVLGLVEGRGENNSYRDYLNYYITIFGKPSNDNLWGWRIEGHHLSINFSSLKGELISATPNFWGSNPATIPSGQEKGKQVLKLESELGFSLVNSLNAEQLKIAVISTTAPSEIMTGNDRQATLQSAQGISYKEMNSSQQKAFLLLLDVYVKNYVFGFSTKLMDKIKKAGIDKLSFAWAGSLTPGGGYYYRMQNPAVLIELDNTQNNANHVHSVVRDLADDFARDILKEHYNKAH
jgi:hypothetical protein